LRRGNAVPPSPTVPDNHRSNISAGERASVLIPFRSPCRELYKSRASATAQLVTLGGHCEVNFVSPKDRQETQRT